MEDGNEFITNTNIICTVCGERQFALREGFYYCQECGTKQEQVRDVEVELGEEFTGSRNLKKQKIKVKNEKPNLTSWECYNYILRGLVNDLLSYGAKEELKLMTLQLWAAYLRRSEVAFFSKKRVELPKLGLRFLQSDASALYNHAAKRRSQKRKRRTTENSAASITSGDTVSAREIRRNRRKLDESIYSSLHSSMTSTEASPTSRSSLNSSSTGTTSRAIKLQFSGRARKHLKKVMPVKHIDKHALDADCNLSCHRVRPLARSINRMDHALFTMNMRQVYAILGLALNLIGDDIQLCDLIRFIDEEHLSVNNVQQYFPENIAPHCNKLLQQIQFYIYPTKYSDKVLRDHIGCLAKFINIREYHRPNIVKLCERYVTELNLPSDVTTYVERLINLLPPKMRTRFKYTYPAYEARTMAYIIFVLKLLFGLDGHTEKLISQSASKTNQCIRQLSEKGRNISGNLTRPSMLFVWEDWVEYVEMRKVIVSHYNSNFCHQFRQYQSTAQVLEEMEEEQRKKIEQSADITANVTNVENKSKVSTIHSIFQQFLDDLNSREVDGVEKKRAETIIFPPSFTPAHSYFKRILLHCSNVGSNATFKIPDFMRVDHMQRTLAPYVHAKELKEYFKQHKWDLHVRRIECTSQRNQVGIFRPMEETRERDGGMKKADFNISEQEWLSSLNDNEIIEELEFKTKLDCYTEGYVKKLEADALKRQKALGGTGSTYFDLHNKEVNSNSNQIPCNVAAADDDDDENLPPAPPDKTIEVNDHIDVLSMHSINVFSECDMEPIKQCEEPITLQPRRGLNYIRLFDDLSDDEDDVQSTEASTSELHSNNLINMEERKCTLLTTTMDCWSLLGISHNLSGWQKKILSSKLPRTFFWLLETCAQTINIDWCIIYEELLTLELMFAYGIEDLEDFDNYIRFKYNNPIKDINMLVNSYRELW
ncbi:TATA box-binding protein-associated factor RNA polymerase I subunit B [Eurosta solidaginis]|uniref:TATA box-binding protein-associated factor RNA polymerase I subunit B n=1 Tax=Eurosta solidaginis TaxID=178769 RepID=UPI0035316B38